MIPVRRSCHENRKDTERVKETERSRETQREIRQNQKRIRL